MAYLTEQLSNKELTVATSNNTQSEATAASGNLPVFHRLIDEKTKLIKLLSYFPATALWLLNKYQQDCFIDGQNNEAVIKADLIEPLANIKKQFELLVQMFAGEGINDTIHTVHKYNLAIAVQQFPFSFSDLSQLVEMVVHVYKLRGYKPAVQCSDLMVKRLESSKPCRLNASKLADLFKTEQFKAFDESFLFLFDDQMYRYFIDIVPAEHHWLKARQQLAEANIKLVLFIANQYKGGFLDFDDLVQEGQTGLLKAVDKFDPQLGFQFSTYAGYWIRQAISRALSRCERVVRIPCGQVATVNKVYRAKDELLGKTGKEPSVNDLAKHTNLSGNEINTILSISQSAISLEINGDEDDVFAPIDFLEQQVFTHPFNQSAASNLQALLGEAIETLSPREAQVICSHFGVDADKEMTLQEIGSELNLTRERVRQIQAVALNKIKLNYGQQLAYFL